MRQGADLDLHWILEQDSRVRAKSGTRELMARDLLESTIVGLWADRHNFGNSIEYARRLRREAEHRRELPQVIPVDTDVMADVMRLMGLL